MIGYQMVGTNDLDKAIAFYEQIMAILGAGRFMEDEGKFVAWATSPKAPGFSVTVPYDGKPASVGNGSMTAFVCKDTAMVDTVYETAIAAGATCEGKPGLRGGGFYAAYFRDLDGNKLNAFAVPSA